MISWADIETRQLDHEQRVQHIEQTHWMQAESPSTKTIDRWQWRLMNKLGAWLVEVGSRLQTHVEQARQVVRSSPMAMETNSNSTQPCP